MAGRTEKSAADRSSRQRLQDRGDAERQEREAEHVDRRFGRQLGQLNHQRGKDELDAYQADVLKADECGQHRRRNVVQAVNEFSRLSRLRRWARAPPQLEQGPRVRYFSDKSSEPKPLGSVRHARHCRSLPTPSACVAQMMNSLLKPPMSNSRLTSPITPQSASLPCRPAAARLAMSSARKPALLM